MSAEPIASCRGCGHFRNAAPLLEAALPNLNSLSSAHAAVRADDGLCAVHDRYVRAVSVCDRLLIVPAQDFLALRDGTPLR
jgi:hypothetical protein